MDQTETETQTLIMDQTETETQTLIMDQTEHTMKRQRQTDTHTYTYTHTIAQTDHTPNSLSPLSHTFNTKWPKQISPSLSFTHTHTIAQTYHTLNSLSLYLFLSHTHTHKKMTQTDLPVSLSLLSLSQTHTDTHTSIHIVCCSVYVERTSVKNYLSVIEPFDRISVISTAQNKRSISISFPVLSYFFQLLLPN